MKHQTIVANEAKGFDNLELEVYVMDQPIRGVLNGSEKSWEFKSEDPTFLETYPSGAMYSFSIFGEDDTSNEYCRYHAAMSAKINELLA